VTDLDLDALAVKHYKAPGWTDGGSVMCAPCGEFWPCLTSRLIAKARRARELEAQVADWREVLAEVAFRKDEDGVGFCDWEQIRTRAALARYPEES